MGLLIRTVQRIAIFTIGAVSVWLIVFVVFDFADKELPVFFALSATYAIGAYVILPYAVRMGLKVLAAPARAELHHRCATDCRPIPSTSCSSARSTSCAPRSPPSAGWRPIG